MNQECSHAFERESMEFGASSHALGVKGGDSRNPTLESPHRKFSKIFIFCYFVMKVHIYVNDMFKNVFIKKIFVESKCMNYGS